MLLQGDCSGIKLNKGIMNVNVRAENIAAAAMVPLPLF